MGAAVFETSAVQVSAAVTADPRMALQHCGAAAAHVGGAVWAGDAPGVHPTQRPNGPDRRRPEQDAGKMEDRVEGYVR